MLLWRIIRECFFGWSDSNLGDCQQVRCMCQTPVVLSAACQGMQLLCWAKVTMQLPDKLPRVSLSVCKLMLQVVSCVACDHSVKHSGNNF